MGQRWIDSPAKRAVDVAAAGTALLALAPVLAGTAMAVRWKLGAPVLFRQQRAGRDGAAFDVIKFRSMIHGDAPDAERLTGFGRALRSTSLDELPQLWNVVRGDMSLIGPRPLPAAYVPRYSPVQRRRLDARPGITGWAQVHGRNTVDWPARLALDVDYVEQASPLLDARIVWRTIRALVTRSGVSADDHATMYEFTGHESTGPEVTGPEVTGHEVTGEA